MSGIISYTELETKVKSMIKPSRFTHSEGVVEMSRFLADRFNLDKDIASYIGIYHDAYRYSCDESTPDYCREHGIEVFPEEEKSPMLLHGALAAIHFSEDAEGEVPEFYKTAVRHHTLGHKEMGPYGPVTFRTFDFGGDKQIEWMNLNEENPILGWRAVRFCMERKDIFAHQLAAILKASAYADDVRIMFPMISGIEELKSVLAFFDEVKAICRASGVKFNEDMQIGTMIEVPSAAICSDILADYVDFMSIGTNDLIQYTLAVDRGNDKISYLYKPLHPAVLRLIKYVVDSAKAKGVTVSMCGEMAGMPEYLPILIGMGFDELSMANHSVLVAKKRMRELDSISCTRLVNHVLSLPDASSVEEALKEFNSQYGKA